MQTGNSIYLDYQATTPLDPHVIDVLTQSQNTLFANPHSTQHVLGQQSAQVVEQARSDIESLINAASEEVIFTSGATESNNQAIASTLLANKTPRNRLLISAIEHKCIKNAAYYYAARLGAKVEEIPVLPTGLIDLEAYQRMLDDDVLLVCVMAVNNEIGTIQDIRTLAEMAHHVGALFHCDAAQAPEAIDIDVEDWQVDMLSLSAHKVYGPKGIGALFVKNHLQASLPPLIHGGGQQSGMRSGTVPTNLCAGFAAAMRLSRELATENRPKINQLKQLFINRLTEAGIDFKLNGDQQACHPGNINIQLTGFNATELLEKLQPDVCASTGSACNSEMVLPSHVLKAIGLTDEQVLSSIRFSLGRFSDSAQVDQSTRALIDVLQQP